MPKPFRAILCAGRPATFSPWKMTSPAVGRSMPMMVFIAVDLPEPLGPIRPKISPACTSRSRFLTAVRPPKRLVRPRTSRTGGLLVVASMLAALVRKGRAEEAAGEEQHDKQRGGRDDEGGELAGRP